MRRRGHTAELITGHCGLQMIGVEFEGDESARFAGKRCTTPVTTGSVGQRHYRAGMDMTFTRHHMRISSVQSGLDTAGIEVSYPDAEHAGQPGQWLIYEGSFLFSQRNSNAAVRRRSISVQFDEVLF
ncbi:hypothetical protein LMQ14_05515 [Mycobacterium sp. Aquia_213]|nr:hypothetical protein [Mycobacterium sp. Aquia_213]WAC92628.1 hypothetical protein LMQ14_05515 [Mycobacterium sp. Aquia_213]